MWLWWIRTNHLKHRSRTIAQTNQTSSCRQSEAGKAFSIYQRLLVLCGFQHFTVHLEDCVHFECWLYTMDRGYTARAHTHEFTGFKLCFLKYAQINCTLNCPYLLFTRKLYKPKAASIVKWVWLKKKPIGLEVITPICVMYTNEMALKQPAWTINQVVNVENKPCF